MKDKFKYALFGVIPVALIAVILVILLNSQSGGSSSNIVNKIEGEGYSTPEKAALAYLDGLKNQDVNAMMKAIAVENYAENYDLKELISQMHTYTPVGQISLPNGCDFAKQLIVQERLSYISGNIVRQMKFYAYPDEMKGFGELIWLKDEANIESFILKISDDTAFKALSTLEVEKVFVGDKLHKLNDEYESDAAKKWIDNKRKELGADELSGVAVLLEIDGDKYIFCCDAVRYSGGKWLIANLGGSTASILDISPFYEGLSVVGDDDDRFD